jgi:3-oxoacyl-[acyl-carrier-protein] synthase-1
MAIDAALARAGVAPEAVDYLNLHGTASDKNDTVEAALVARRFPASTRASSTKAYAGHTLGAAGGLGAITALAAIEHDLVPGNLNCATPDPACGPQLARESEHRPVRVALCNALGFGGNNACLAFEAAP